MAKQVVYYRTAYGFLSVPLLTILPLYYFMTSFAQGFHTPARPFVSCAFQQNAPVSNQLTPKWSAFLALDNRSQTPPMARLGSSAFYKTNMKNTKRAFCNILSRIQSTQEPQENDNSRMYSNVLKRRNVQLPLLDMSSLLVASSSQTGPKGQTQGKQDGETNENDDIMTPVIPLPSSHLPDELATLQIYGMQLQAGIHKLMMKDITISSNPLSSFSILEGDINDGIEEPAFGCVVEKSGEDWVGAIGCAADVIFVMDNTAVETDDVIIVNDNTRTLEDDLVVMSPNDENEPLIVLCKGSFRFIVKEVIQTFPYPIAIVDELLDDEPLVSTSDSLVTKITKEYNDFQDSFEDDDEDDEEEEEEEDLSSLTAVDPSDLIPRTMAAMKAIVDQQLNVKMPNMTPLEEAILKESGRDPNLNMIKLEQSRAEEMAAILEIFASSLLDVAPSRMERFYVVAIMAAEFAGLDNDVRKRILTMVDGVERLRLVLAEVEKKISLGQAKKITNEIMEKNDEVSKELKVGVPTLPPWAKSIKKGVKIEYFWNEIEGWCKGEVIEDPVMIVDELIVTVMFDDGDVHKLPFRGDEKARWRPGGMGR